MEKWNSKPGDVSSHRIICENWPENEAQGGGVVFSYLSGNSYVWVLSTPVLTARTPLAIGCSCLSSKHSVPTRRGRPSPPGEHSEWSAWTNRGPLRSQRCNHQKKIRTFHYVWFCCMFWFSIMTSAGPLPQFGLKEGSVVNIFV